MSTGWFQRATGVFGRPEPAPQWFDVGCDCGARLKGERAADCLKPKCPACGTVVFILPATVYPVPVSLRQRWLNPDAAPPADETKRPPEPEKTGRAKTGKKPAGAPVEERSRRKSVEAPAPDKAPAEALSLRLRRWFTPVRLLAIAIISGSLLTGFVLYRQVRWSQAQTQLQAALDRGTEAIEAGNFSTAAREYQAAVTSLDILGRRDVASQRIRSRQQQVQIMSEPLEEPLSTLLDNWLTAPGDNSSLPASAGQRWLVLDTRVVPTQADQYPAGTLLVDLPIMCGDVPVELLIEPRSSLASLVAASSDAARVLFAAQIDRGEPPTPQRPTARVWLTARRIIPLTDDNVAEHAGLFPDEAAEREATRQLLRQQRERQEQQP